MPENMNPFITTLFCTGYKHPSALVGSYSGCAGGISPFTKSSAQSLTALLYKETQRAFKTRSCGIRGGVKNPHIIEWAKPKQQIYWLKRNNVVLLVLSPGTVGYQVVRAAARQRRGTHDRGVGLAPLWTYALSSEINHSLYHSCSIWSHNHYPTAEKEMKPLIARGVGLSVQSRKVFIKFSFEKWFFMASFAGHAAQKLDILSNCLQHIEPIYLEPL